MVMEARVELASCCLRRAGPYPLGDSIIGTKGVTCTLNLKGVVLVLYCLSYLGMLVRSTPKPSAQPVVG